MKLKRIILLLFLNFITIRLSWANASWTPLQMSLFSPIHLFDEESDVYGLRAGIFYSRNDNIYGFDLGPFYNLVDSDMIGIQAGSVNQVNGNTGGIQFATIANKVEGNAYGIQYAFLMNEVRGDGGGIQFGIFNSAHGTYYGIQISPLWQNFGNVNGFQYASCGNGCTFLNRSQSSYLAPGNVNGLSVTLGWNAASRVNGIQIAVLANSCDELNGIQIGGVVNESQKRVKGLQFGIANYSETMNGVQMGIINISHNFHGIQFGFLNIIINSPVPVLPIINARF